MPQPICQYRYFEIESSKGYVPVEITKKDYKEFLFPDKPQIHKLIVEVAIIPTENPDYPKGLTLKLTNLYSTNQYRGVSAIIETVPAVDKKFFSFKSSIGKPGSLGKDTWREFCLKMALRPMINALAEIERKVAEENSKDPVLSIEKNAEELYWIFRVLMKLQ